MNARSWPFGFLCGAIVLGSLVRRLARRLESHLSDVTGLRFVRAFAQMLVFLVGFILYTHLVPELRTLGTALLAGVNVVSVVLGFAAQTTVILMSQTRQADKDRQRATHDYEVNLKAELEIMELHEKIELLKTQELARIIELQTAQIKALEALIAKP